MTDRELLERAAKAAGIEHVGYCFDGIKAKVAHTRCGYVYWNPLTNDADAFRLAVALGIVIDTGDGVHVMYILDGVAYPITEYEFTDRLAATRRAITRAAALSSPLSGETGSAG